MQYNKDNPLRCFFAFEGYNSQGMALNRIKENYPDFDWVCVGRSEIDVNAIKAANAIFPESTDKNYGNIQEIDWKEVPDFDLLTMSSPCFVAGTLVHTDRGYIPIEQVTTEDRVLTHTNQYQTVIAVGHNENKPIIKVRGMCFKDILCTPNHPFLARKRYRLWNNDRRVYDRKFTDAEWIRAENLTKDHYVGYAINQKSELPKWDGIIATRWRKIENKLTALFTNPSFWYLMGRYVGDGWKRVHPKYGNSVIICCSDRNRDSLFKAIEDCGIHGRGVKERTVEKVFISSNELAAFVNRYGYYAHGKKIDAETINLPDYLLRSFVQGYVDSDGCYTENEYKATTVSEELMYGIQHCIVKAYKCPVRMYWCKRKPTTVIEGRIVNQRDSFTIAWHPQKRKQDKAFYEDGYVWFPIKEVIEINDKATVYNMEVENDNSYTANGAIVHNCQDFSVAGRQAGGDEGSGTRSSLLWECRKAIIAKKPRYILFENVSAVVSKKFIRGFNKWQAELESYGYTNFAKVLNSKDYGVPQNRERLFMLSILGGQSYHFPEPFKLEKRIKDILEPYGTVDESFYFTAEQLAGMLKYCKRKSDEGCGFQTNFRTDDDIATCVTSRYGAEYTNTYLREPSLQQRLSIYGNNAQAGRVYDVEGIAPCIDTCSGGNRMPKILTPVRTEEAKDLRRKGIEVFKHRELVPREDGVSNTITTVTKDNLLCEPAIIQRPHGFNDGGLFSDVSPTITTSSWDNNNLLKEPCILGYTRDDNGKVCDRHDKNIANTVHTSTGNGGNTDQFVKEPLYARLGETLEKADLNGKDSVISDEYNKVIYDDIAPTITTRVDASGNVRLIEKQPFVFANLPDKTVLKDEDGKGYLWQDNALWRVRKLVPIEVGRLMDCSDDDVQKMIDAGISKSALYGLFGNSIVVSVLYHILRKLWIDTENESPQKSLFDF